MFAPYSLGPTVLTTAYTLTGLSTAVVIVRFYCRIWVVGKLKSYDYIMLAALICTWGVCVVNYFQFHTGSGERTKPAGSSGMTPQKLHKVLISSATSWYAYQIMYLGDLALIKFSILSFYYSIATQRVFRASVIACFGVVTVYTVITIFINAFECPKDPSVALTPSIFGSERRTVKCFDLATLYYSQAAFNIVTDVAILVLPMPVIINLRMHALKKLSVFLVFSAGILVPVASGLRLWSLFVWAKSSSNSRYAGGYVVFWSQIELNTAIICASMPSLQPLLKCVYSRVSSRWGNNSYYYYYGDGPGSMVETGRRTGQAFSHRVTIDDFEPPVASYQPHPLGPEPASENGLVLIRPLSHEEEIRDRVRMFVSSRSSVQSDLPKSPARPENILNHG